MFVERNTPSSVSKRERHNLQTVVILILRNIRARAILKRERGESFPVTVDIF